MCAVNKQMGHLGRNVLLFDVLEDRKTHAGMSDENINPGKCDSSAYMLTQRTFLMFMYYYVLFYVYLVCSRKANFCVIHRQ